MTHERYAKLDEVLKPLCKDFDEFESGAEIVRIGDWGYMTVSDYESHFTTTRERNEYQALSNAEANGEADIFTALVISNASDEELSDILDAQLDDAIIYYTEAE